MSTAKTRLAAAQELRQKYAGIGMSGTARLVDFLGSKHAEGLQEFGSSSIGPSGNGRLYIGRPKANPPVTPLEDMEHNFLLLRDFLEEDRKKIDVILGAMGDSMFQVTKLRYRIPGAFRHWVIDVFRAFGWKVSDEMSFGMKWWWVPFYHKLKRQRELKRAGLV